MCRIIITSLFLFCYLNLLHAQETHTQFAATIGGTGLDQVYGTDVDGYGNIYLAGIFKNTTDFDPGSGTFDLTSNGGKDIFVLKLDAYGNFLWARSIGGSSDDYAYALSVSPSGQVYVTGTFHDTVDFDPGPNVSNLVQTAVDGDAYILKLDVQGELVWVKKAATGYHHSIYAITLDKQENVYISGLYENTVDFDPGPGTFNMTSQTDGEYFLLKLSSSGNLQWAKSVGNGGGIRMRALAVDDQENIYASGDFYQTPDFDPGPGIFTLTSNMPTDIFVMKLDINGDLAFAKGMTSSNYGVSQGIALDQAGNIYHCGSFSGTTDFDPGAGVVNLTGSSSVSDIFVQKLDNQGNYQWAKMINGGNLDMYGKAIAYHKGNVLITGQFSHTVDFDPGVGIFELTGIGNQITPYTLKLDTAGNFVWAKSLPGQDLSYGQDISVDSKGNVITVGYFEDSIDLDPGPGMDMFACAGLVDIFITKWDQDSCANLTLTIDSVNNVTCVDDGLIAAHAFNGLPPYQYIWNTTPETYDSVITVSSGGFYEVTVTDGNHCTRSTNVLINGPTYMNGFDLNANLRVDGFCPAQPASIKLDAFNDGCIDTSGQLKLTLDSRVAYQQASPIPDMVSGDTLTWNFASLEWNGPHFQPYVTVMTDSNVNIGDEVCLTVNIDPIAGDADSTNNVKDICFDVVNSFDPNDIQVYPKGACNVGYILESQVLTYTIRFQNTGDAEAINVTIMDTLPASLDVSTIRVLSTSHDMLITELLDSNALKFHWNNILLADSSSNVAESSGYVTYEVMPSAGQPNGTVIKNSAAIYFDLNEPVFTNTVSNTLIDVIPVNDTLINASVCHSYNLNNQTYSSSGIYTQTLISANGCDSIITLNLSVNSTSATFTEASCYSYTSPSGNYTWTMSGTYQDTILNKAGCDSVLTLEVTIADSTYATLTESACGPYELNGQTYANSGTYQQTLVNTRGCDSILILDLTIDTVETGVDHIGNHLIATATNADYQWLDCDANYTQLSGAIQATFTPATNGNYAVAVTQNTCKDTSACQTVAVISSVMEQGNPDHFSIYPNPTNGQVILQGQVLQADAQLEVLNLQGQVVYQKTLTNTHRFQFELHGPSGVYLVKVVATNGEIVKQVVVKE